MTETEEMYLVHVAQANENGQDPVALAHLATAFNIQPVSAHHMIKKLDEAGLLVYTPYKGVELTSSGRAIATQILRRRRLWEVFLAEKLGLDPITADETACRLEHIAPDHVVDRLYTFLERPQSSPQGKPIPLAPSSDQIEAPLDSPLAGIAAGESVVVAAIQPNRSDSAAIKNFLRHAGIKSGVTLEVLAIQDTGACLVQPEGFPSIQLSSNIANAIRVR